MEHYQAGWGVVSKNIVGWIIYTVTFCLVVTFTFGLGALLGLSFLRGAKAAIAQDASPEIGAIFDFEHIVDDIIVIVVMAVGNFIGGLLAGIGALISGTLLFWCPMLVADGVTSGADSWKASLAHTKGNFVDILIFMLLGAVVNFVGGLACGLGVLVTVPVTVVAGWLFYNASKEQILAGAQQDGVPLIG